MLPGLVGLGRSWRVVAGKSIEGPVGRRVNEAAAAQDAGRHAGRTFCAGRSGERGDRCSVALVESTSFKLEVPKLLSNAAWQDKLWCDEGMSFGNLHYQPITT